MTQNKVSNWIFILSIVITLMEFAGAALLFFDPASIAHDVDVKNPGVEQIIAMWAVRQFALAIIFAYATWKRTRAHLTLAYLFLLVMMLGDVVISLKHQDLSSAAMAGIMSLISVLTLWSLHKQRN